MLRAFRGGGDELVDYNRAWVRFSNFVGGCTENLFKFSAVQ